MKSTKLKEIYVIVVPSEGLGLPESAIKADSPEPGSFAHQTIQV